MANTLQRTIYHLANLVPLMLMSALVWYIQYNTCYVPCILVAASITVIIVFYYYFTYGKNNCSVKNINVTSIASKDIWFVAYVILYIFPFAKTLMSDFYFVILLLVFLILALVIILSNIALPNVLLFIVGYHFYEVKTDSTGISDYLLISKRKSIRNKADVKQVIRVFEKLLIDLKGDK